MLAKCKATISSESVVKRVSFFLSEPKNGYALDTPFTVSCSNWTDDTTDLPLAYKFAYKTSSDDFEQMIYFGSKSVAPPIKLPLGKPELNHSVSIIVHIEDSFAAPQVYYLNVTVRYRKHFNLLRHDIRFFS